MKGRNGQDCQRKVYSLGELSLSEGVSSWFIPQALGLLFRDLLEGRPQGTDKKLTDLAEERLEKVGLGHGFLLSIVDSRILSMAIDRGVLLL